MFKKGAFEIDDVEIVPICVKYGKLFSDPYWPSKNESFLSYLLRLCSCWCVTADVYFLEPQKRKIRPIKRSIDVNNDKKIEENEEKSVNYEMEHENKANLANDSEFEEEDPVDFANRVQQLIAQKGNLKIVNKNGYLKYFTPSETLKEERQRYFAYQLTKFLAAKDLKLDSDFKNDENNKENEKVKKNNNT